ncbi:hypothetical protein [Candidatus Uabimicrobium sp. HlEnr_7]|uniref:hypothetical protein n=1 Tax=Candidatus Uabimicrobium helgolandensis TaxID=3095367 RepID=UPI003556F9CA
MRSNISKDFSENKIRTLLENYPKTLEVAVSFSVSIYCLSEKNRMVYRDFLDCLKTNNFRQILEIYGDSFAEQILREIHEDTITEQDVEVVQGTLKNTFAIYTNDDSKELIQNTLRTFTNTGDIETSVIGIFNSLAINLSLCKKYIHFFQKIQHQQDLLLSTLQTTYFITKYLGTHKAYVNFIKLCEKLESESLFQEVIHTLKTLAQYGSPEIFVETTSWACETPVDKNSIIHIFKHSYILLDQKNQSTYSMFCFGKFMAYVKDKEQRFMDMPDEDLEYYIEKAVEFFVEA